MYISRTYYILYTSSTIASIEDLGESMPLSFFFKLIGSNTNIFKISLNFHSCWKAALSKTLNMRNWFGIGSFHHSQSVFWDLLGAFVGPGILPVHESRNGKLRQKVVKCLGDKLGELWEKLMWLKPDSVVTMNFGQSFGVVELWLGEFWSWLCP